MILLDTNVLSELMRESPDPKVAAWVGAHDASQFLLTTITIAEIYRGLLRLPEGKRRQRLEAKFLTLIRKGFPQRVLVFDESAAPVFGQLCLQREKAGMSVDPVDMMIAAIAKTRAAAVATRNTSDFSGLDIEIINPWL